MKKKLLTFLLGSLAITGVSFAGTTNGILNVQAEVSGDCTLDIVNINFGVITVTTGKVGEATATGKIKTTCTKDTAYTIKLGSGNTGNFSTSRTMVSANPSNLDKLQYNKHVS